MSIENIQIIETVSLDFYNNNIKMINVKQLDTDARGVKVNCTEHGKKFKLDPISHSAFVRYKKPDGYDVFNDCYIQDDGSVIFALTQQMTAVSGKSILDILIFCASGLTVENIENITSVNDLGISTLSTMTLELNIHKNATDLHEIESTYEYNALIGGLARHVAIEKHMENLNDTLISNENQRQEDENSRQNAETKRVVAEDSRVTAEKIREVNIQNTIKECNNATNNANIATDRANDSANKADIATSNAEQVTNNATIKTQEMQILMENINKTIGGVINDEIVSESTTYSSQKIENRNLQNNTVTFESYDNADEYEAILEVPSIMSNDKLGTIISKITKFCNNIRYLFNFIKVADIQEAGYTSVADAINNIGQDYIVEQGTDGMWTYRKWKSGIAECWGIKNFGTLDVTTAWYEWYESITPITADFPSNFFVSTPEIVDVNPIRVGGTITFLGRMTEPTNTNTGNCYVSRPTSSTLNDCRFSFRAIGRWKE